MTPVMDLTLLNYIINVSLDSNIRLLKIPIPSEDVENKINSLVDKIISAKKLNESTIDLEAEKDEMVNKLYDLTGEDIEIIKCREDK